MCGEWVCGFDMVLRPVRELFCFCEVASRAVCLFSFVKAVFLDFFRFLLVCRPRLTCVMRDKTLHMPYWVCGWCFVRVLHVSEVSKATLCFC